jgi:hypothetical protein
MRIKTAALWTLGMAVVLGLSIGVAYGERRPACGGAMRAHAQTGLGVPCVAHAQASTQQERSCPAWRWSGSGLRPEPSSGRCLPPGTCHRSRFTAHGALRLPPSPNAPHPLLPGLAGFVEYPTQELVSGLLPIDQLASLSNRSASDCIKPGEGLPGFNATNKISGGLVGGGGGGGGRDWGLGGGPAVRGRRASLAGSVPRGRHASVGNACCRPEEAGRGSRVVGGARTVAERVGSGAEGAPPPAPQCDGYGAGFTLKTWTLRVSLPVYIMAIQSVFGEGAGRAPGRSACRGLCFGPCTKRPPHPHARACEHAALACDTCAC